MERMGRTELFQELDRLDAAIDNALQGKDPVATTESELSAPPAVNTASASERGPNPQSQTNFYFRSQVFENVVFGDMR
jgi:hypothetical protein